MFFYLATEVVNLWLARSIAVNKQLILGIDEDLQIRTRDM